MTLSWRNCSSEASQEAERPRHLAGGSAVVVDEADPPAYRAGLTQRLRDASEVGCSGLGSGVGRRLVGEAADVAQCEDPDEAVVETRERQEHVLPVGAEMAER